MFPCNCCTSTGYWAHGETLNFTTELNSSTPAVGIVVGFGDGSASNTSDKGYWLGGSTNGATTHNNANKLTFATATCVAQSSANISSARGRGGCCGDRSTKAFYCGGVSFNGFGVGTYMKKADKITFSTDASSVQTSADLSTTRQYSNAVWDSGTKGYFLGGWTGGAVTFVTTADKIVFSTDTTAAQTSANLSQGRQQGGGVSDGTTAGYLGGGQTAALTWVATTDKITFSSDTSSAVTSANLSGIRSATLAQSQGSVKAFWCGGVSSLSPVVLSDKITFATAVTASNTTSNLVAAYRDASGMSQTGL